MKVGELLAELFTKAGVDVTDEKLKPLLGITAEIEDSFVTPLQTNLFNLEAAKSKATELKEHFIKPFAQGIDIGLRDFLEEHGLTEIQEKVKAAKSTTDRTKTVLAELIALSKQKSTGSADHKLLQDQILALNAQIAETRRIAEEEKNGLISGFENERLNSALESQFNAQNWSELYPKDVRITLAKTLFENELKKHNAKVKREQNGLSLVSNEGDLPIFDTKNNPVSFDSLVSKIFQENNLFKVAQQSPTPSSFTPEHRTVAPTSRQTAFEAQMAKSLADQGL